MVLKSSLNGGAITRRFQNRRLFVTVCLVVVLMAGSCYWLHKRSMDRSRRVLPVRAWIPLSPWSADPLDSNFISHQMVLRSVASTLISRHRLGGYTGVISDRWAVNDDFTRWMFHLRPNLTFEDGERITPEVVAASLVRAGAMLSKKGNEGTPFEFIKGDIVAAFSNQSFEGIRATEDSVEFRFQKPMKHLLDVLSMATYAIVSRSDFDSRSGRWVNPKKITASGPYRIEYWNDESLGLVRRAEVRHPDFHPRMIERLRFGWNNREKIFADLVLGHSLSNGYLSTHDFFGGPMAGVAYLRCHSWNKADSICGHSELRRALRNSFYRIMESSGYHIDTRFFVGGGPQEQQYLREKEALSILHNKKSSLKVLASRSTLNPYFSAYSDALSKAAREVGLDVTIRELAGKEVLRENDPNLVEYHVDISARATEVDFGAIDRELVMMFLSPEGLRLPDVDGSIRREIVRGEVDLQMLNRLIWQQAVIWPMAHFSQGLFVRKSLLDMSRLNVMVPPLELQWIGWN